MSDTWDLESTPIDPQSLANPGALGDFTDTDLAWAVGLLLAEQRRRALERGDLEAVAVDAFEKGFDRTGRALTPWLHEGLLVCPGSKSEKSQTSHDCTFVSLDDGWVWEHPELAFDEMRQLPGARVTRQSISLVPSWEGMRLDMVTSTSRSGPCRMKSARTFEVREGVLVEVSARARRPDSHR
jgi:hypothetical protein